MTFLCVVPAVDRVALHRCVDSLNVPTDNLIVIDNAGGACSGIWPNTHSPPNGWNWFTTRAWNLAARKVMADELDWLVICSTSITAGPDGFYPFAAMLNAAHGKLPLVESLHGWKLIALARSTLERCGLFDENFLAYQEDSEYIIRLWHAGLLSLPAEPVERCFVDGGFSSAGDGMTIRSGAVTVNQGAQVDYLYAKWGTRGLHYGDPETLTRELDALHGHPFGNPDHALDWWQPWPLEVVCSRYGVPLVAQPPSVR